MGHNMDNEFLLLDVNPLSLGLRLAGDVMDKIISRNMNLPISKSQFYSTTLDN